MSGFPLRFVEEGATRRRNDEATRVAAAPPAGGVTVVTAGVWEWVRRWVEAWERSPSAGRWPVAIGWAEDFPDDALARLKGRGYGLIDMRRANAECLRLFFHAYNARVPPNRQRTPHHALWGAKVRAIMECPTRWCVWLDHDAEVRGDIGPLVRRAQELGKWMASPKYASFGTGAHPSLVAQHGVCVVDTWRPELHRWWAAMVLHDQPHDERAVVAMYGGFSEADQAVGDLYRPDWYASCDCFPERWTDINGAAARRVLDSNAAIRHWCGKTKAFYRRLYP